jgi:hypothetical protein
VSCARSLACGDKYTWVSLNFNALRVTGTYRITTMACVLKKPHPVRLMINLIFQLLSVGGVVLGLGTN